MSGSRSSSVPGSLIGGFYGGFIGGGLGIIAASILDATLLGHEKVLVPAEEANAAKANAVTWFPTASVGPQGAHAGLAGAF